jgi:hypothetical protein
MHAPAGTLALDGALPAAQGGSSGRAFLSLQLLGPDLFELAEGGAFARDTPGQQRLAAVGVCMLDVSWLRRVAWHGAAPGQGAVALPGGQVDLWAAAWQLMQSCRSQTNTPRRLVQTLEFIHGRGIIHGDVKPGAAQAWGLGSWWRSLGHACA